MMTNSNDNLLPVTKLTHGDGDSQTNRHSRYMWREVNRNLDVAYVNQIMNFRDHIKPLSCNKDDCPVVKERLRQHQLQCHPDYRNLETQVNNENGSHGVGTPSHSSYTNINDRGIFTADFNDHSAQTESPVRSNDTFTSTAIVKEANVVEKSVRNKDYKDNLRKSIRTWLQELPICPNFDESTKMIKERMVHDLFDIIYDLSIANFSKVANTLGVNTTFIEKSSLSRNAVVLTSEHNLSSPGPLSYPITSTPKKTARKEVPRLNEDETSYMEKVAQLVRAWMETLSKEQNAFEDKEFKETVINDLAGDIMDEVKLEQMSPDADAPKEKLIYFFLLRWLYRHHVYNDLKEPEPQAKIEDFMKRFKDIDIPDLTKPQHGNRQAMGNIKFSHTDSGWERDYIPRATDILEDEISVWMNEQLSDIYLSKHKDDRNKMIHELALSMEKNLKKKQPDGELKKELMNWVEKMVKKEEKQNVALLSEKLKERIMKIPMDETLAQRHNRKMKMRKEYIDHVTHQQQQSANAQETADVDRTLKEMIAKYIKHNYQIDDSLVKSAFGQLLETAFKKLCTPTQKDDTVKSKTHNIPSKQKFDIELQYIKYISDWLKNVQIDSSFNTPDNKKRIEFVNDLAKNICEIELNRIESHNAVDYDAILKTIINQSISHLPILPDYIQYTEMMANQLFNKIIANRTSEIRSLMNSVSPNKSNNMQDQPIGEFIDQYIETNSKDMIDDQLKSDACTARFLNEVTNMVNKTLESPASGNSRNGVSATSAGSSDETIKQFDKELTYAKEIGDWMKNMPLQPILNPELKETRIKQISDLAEHISNNDKSIINDSYIFTPDTEFFEFITNWISKLSLSPNQTIDVSTLVQQLQRRIKRLNEVPPDQTEPKKNSTIKDRKKLRKQSKKSNERTSSNDGNSGELIVNAIETWCNKIPVHGKNKDDVQKLQSDVTRRLFQKVGELTTNPRINNDNVLYSEMLGDEVDLILADLPKTNEIEKKKDGLKKELIENVIDAKAIIKEKTAGDDYKHKLENTIEVSLPTPAVDRKIYDPGFEMYKDRLANMFILENFDHGNDTVKIKYERRIKDEIDKYFQHAQKRNAIPLSRDEIYNELYSALFKVPIPNETSVLQEVKEIKTRCDIETWFEELPLRQTANLNEELEREQIVSTLTKRICEIEKKHSNPDNEIHKEVTKWLAKLPFQSSQEDNIEKFAQDLESKLKSNKEERNCVTKSQRKKGTSIKKTQRNENKSLENSQIAGPSSASKAWYSPQSCCQDIRTSRKKSGDVIFEIVENWCNQLPLYANTAEEKDKVQALKDNLITKILVKVSELYVNPKTFSNDLLFSDYLDDELERLTTDLPVCCDFQNSKDTRKNQLKAALNSVKPLIEEERARPEYNKELRNTVTHFFEEPQNTTAEKLAMYRELVEDIANNFVQYNYNRDDFEGKQVYKNAVREAIEKYFLEIRNTDAKIDHLMKQNQLLCELAKIPIPNEDIIREEVEEINMKNEVSKFLNEIVPDEKSDKTLKKQMESNLAKRLNDIEQSGHTCKNDKTMKEEISRALRKLGTEDNMDKIEAFVSKLKDNEMSRKALPFRKSDNISVNVSEQLKANATGRLKSIHRSSHCNAPMTEFLQQNNVPFSQMSSQRKATSLQYPHQIRLNTSEIGPGTSIPGGTPDRQSMLPSHFQQSLRFGQIPIYGPPQQNFQQGIFLPSNYRRYETNPCGVSLPVTNSKGYDLEDKRAYSLREPSPQNRLINGAGVASGAPIDGSSQPCTLSPNLADTRSQIIDAPRMCYLHPGSSIVNPPRNTPSTYLPERNENPSEQIPQQNEEEPRVLKSPRKRPRTDSQEERQRCICRNRRKHKSCMPRYSQECWYGLPPFWMPFCRYRCF